MGEVVQFAEITDRGLKRNENQDSIYYFSNNDVSLFVVADGMGGLENGKESSQAVVDAAEQWINNFSKDLNASHQEDMQSLLRAFDTANAKVYMTAKQNHNMSGSTLASILITKGMASCIIIGDSRIYRMRGAVFTQMLEDHVWQNMPEVKNKHYSISELRASPQYGRLSNYVGMDMQAVFSVYTEKIVKNDVFLICSDGVYKPCGDEVLMSAMQKAVHIPMILSTKKLLMKLLLSLKDFVFTKHAPDNLSAIIIKC